MRRTGVKLGGNPFQTILHNSFFAVEQKNRRKTIFVVEKFCVGATGVGRQDHSQFEHCHVFIEIARRLPLLLA